MSMGPAAPKKILLIILAMICWRESFPWTMCNHARHVLEHHLVATPSSPHPSCRVRLFATQYSIEEDRVDDEVLDKTVRKHFENLQRFLDSKPVAAHTNEAFSTLESMLQESSMRDAPIILDSGCGTGKSTIKLGQLYPNHVVVGVDRSLARLTKNGIYREQDKNNGSDSNVFFVRADLTDFWRLWTTSSLPKPEQHYLLYPNPYPKKRRFQNRWYAHPSFPIVVRDLDSDKIVVRSNWKAYIDDFASAAASANQVKLEMGDKIHCYLCQMPTILDPTQPAWTNFEQKYFDCGEECYQLVLAKNKGNLS